MFKYVAYLLILFSVNAAWAFNADDYAQNPKAIERALKECPAKHPPQVSCDELNQIALHMNTLATELRLNPQAYGRTILAIQQEIAKQVALNQKNSTPALRATLTKNQQALRERLTIIKWLESPKGA